MNINLGIAVILVSLPSFYLVKLPRYGLFIVFTARCTIVQSVVLPLHVVHLHVTLVDQEHRGWKSWKVIARTISPTPSLSSRPKAIYLIPGKHGEMWGRVEVGWETAAISLKRVKIEKK